MWSLWAWVSAIRTIGAPSVSAAARIRLCAEPDSSVSTSVSPSSSCDEIGVDESELADSVNGHRRRLTQLV